MKIVIIHYRYYMASGPERYLFNVKKLLEQNGHQVIPFSINYPENEKSEYQKYFIDPVVKDGGFHIGQIQNIPVSKKIKIIKNLFYNTEAKIKFKRLIKNEKPDLIYLLQFYQKISTSILDVTKKYSIPVVIRLSDYNLICDKNILYHNKKICEKCFKNTFSVVKNKCIQGSTLKSFFFFLARHYNYLKKINKKFDAIIVPSKFTKEKLQSHHKYKNSNVIQIPTFIWKNEIAGNISFDSKSVDFCYIGRIADDKGIDIILKAFKVLKEKNIEPYFAIFGDVNSKYGNDLKSMLTEWNLNNIHFKGYLKKDILFEKLKDFSFSIIPSVWYDNMPNSFIESQAMGIPVIASRIGSLIELTQEGYNGFLFESQNYNDLAVKIEYAYHLKHYEILTMKKNSVAWVKEYCSEISHYNKLIEVFNEVVRKK